jgi:succinylglutamate desuccinylase
MTKKIEVPMANSDILLNCIDHFVFNDELFKPFSFVTSNNVRVSSTAKGVIEFTPDKANEFKSSFIYSCGIHGNETAPIEIVNDLVKDITLGYLEIKNPLLVIFGNIEAMKVQKRFIKDNLNRMFSGAHRNYATNEVEAPRAKEIENCISDFFRKYSDLKKVHYDLHTAIRASRYPRFAVYPFLNGERKYSKEQLQIFSLMGIQAVLFMHKFATTLSYYSSTDHGADAYTLELGKVKKFGENNRQDFNAAEVVLRSLISGKELSTPSTLPKLCLVKTELIRHEEEYDFLISDDTANFTEYKKGKVLAKDTVESYVVEEDGEMIAFPNGNVKVGQRSGLIMKEISPQEFSKVSFFVGTSSIKLKKY